MVSGVNFGSASKVASFLRGFTFGATGPVSTWSELCKIASDRTITLHTIVPRTRLGITNRSAEELGETLGHFTLAAAALGGTMWLGVHIPEAVDYCRSLMDYSVSYWLKRDMVQSTVPAETFANLTSESIASYPLSTWQKFSYALPYIAAPLLGAVNEFARQWGEVRKHPGTEHYSFGNIAYIAFRFVVGTAVLVKVGEKTWGMPYSKALLAEIASWGIYYSAFTIPRSLLAKKKPTEIDQILRKQVFYSVILNGLGLAALTKWINPLLLEGLNLFKGFGSLEKGGHLAPIVTRAIWENGIITQLVLRAELGGDEFVGRWLARLSRALH
jgi:hypothetical protein